MTGIGRSVRIYMAEGSVLGIKQAEIFNRTIQAIAFPRSRLPEIKDWPETQRPGIYFLFGFDESEASSAYIGEAQDVYGRVKQHVSKDFWEECVVFTNKDENINSKYSEARLISDAIISGRYKLINVKQETIGKLSRSERDAMEEILEDIKVLIGILGHKILEPIDSTKKPVMTVGVDVAIDSKDPEVALTGRIFSFEAKSYKASAKYTDEGFLVLADSTASKDEGVMSDTYKNLRKELILNGDWFDIGNVYRFSKEVLFKSPSAAASVIAGGSRNGRAMWISDGKSVAEWEAEGASKLDKTEGDGIEVPGNGF